MLNEVTPLLAASVIVLRDDPFEVLMLRRHEGASFVPGAWVFPGGIVERDETPAEAGARETREEAGLDLDPASFVATSRWITPVGIPKRFDTWFFLTKIARDAEVSIDRSEIIDCLWISPAEALARPDFRLVFPTIKNLEALVGFDSVDALIDSRRGANIEPVMPVLVNGRPALK
jgi:8-oxo-dGTP pyrophosphatase MutT (NUDIX family)